MRSIDGKSTDGIQWYSLATVAVRLEGEPSEEGEANALLIVSAPQTAAERDWLKETNSKLLTEMKRLLNVVNNTGGLTMHDFGVAWTVMAKAEGRAE